MKALPPPAQKRASALLGGLIQPSPLKTRARAKGGSKKGRFYKPLPKEFQRSGFNYRQIAREGDAAIYEQTGTGCAEPSPAYEVIHIRRREGFEIGARFVEPSEVYPRSEAWGMDGFTFDNRDKAWAKFLRLSLEEPAKTGREVK
jgi:hypothetical protein